MASRRSRGTPRSALGILCTDGFVASTETDGLKWIQCCVEGTFLGHPKFPRIDWTAQVFETLIKNLRSHPSYKAGPDGVGCTRVIPWDYEHANEIRRMQGDIPSDGLPSASWTYDLKAEKNDKGILCLYALTEWLPTAREQIRNGEIIGCSVCVMPSFINPVTGIDQGPTLTSIALTNDPFVQGMEPLAATLEQYGPAESALEVLVGIRSALELTEDATAQQAIEQLRALLDAIASDAVPEYVEEGYILDRIRRLMKLPLLATPEQILGGAEQALNQLLTGEGKALPTEPPTTEQTQMALAILTALSAILCCNDTEQAILQAAKEVAKKADSAEAAVEASGALDQLKALFGSGDVESLLAKATKTIADAKALEPTVTALAEARKALKAGAEADAANEADAIAASMSGGDAEFAKRLRAPILHARTLCIDDNGVVNEERLKKFREDYPLPEEQRALLTRRVVAGPNGVQLGGSVTGLGTQPITQSAGSGKPGAASPDVQKAVEALNASPGRNPIEKANALLCSRNASHKSLEYGEQCRIAGEFVRTLQAGKLPAGFTA